MKDKEVKFAEIKLKEQDNLTEIKLAEIKLKEQDNLTEIKLAEIQKEIKLAEIQKEIQLVQINKDIGKKLVTKLNSDGPLHKFLNDNIIYSPKEAINRTELWERVKMYSSSQHEFYDKIFPEWLRLKFSDKNTTYNFSKFRFNGVIIRG
jgi:hypothetical protein